jgi:hypothetical protein
MPSRIRHLRGIAPAVPGARQDRCVCASVREVPAGMPLVMGRPAAPRASIGLMPLGDIA